VLTESRELGSGRAGRGRAGGVANSACIHVSHWIKMTRHLDDYRCTLLCGILRGSFQETAPRKTAENTAKHRHYGVGSVVANHRGGGESSMVVTTTTLQRGVADNVN